MNVKAVFIFSDFEKAVTNLRAAAAEAESPLEIDGAINVLSNNRNIIIIIQHRQG